MGYILVVDDEKDIRQLIGQILSDEGYQVCLASNSEAAMDEINSKSPDLIILDIWLKDSNMDGIEILKTVRNNAAYNQPYEKGNIITKRFDSTFDLNANLQMIKD